MRQHVHIARRAVEIGEDKGHAVGGQFRAVSAGRLAGAGEHVKQFVTEQHVGKPGGLLAHFGVHFTPRRKDFIRRALGLCVAVGKHQRVVPQHDFVHADAPSLRLVHRVRNRHHIPLDLLTIGFQLLVAVAVSAQAIIAQFQVVFVPQRTCLCIAVFHQFVVKCVKLLPVFLKKLRLGKKGAVAHLAVGGKFVRAKQRQWQFFAVKHGDGAAIEFLILTGKAVFLAHQLHNCGGETAHRHFQPVKKQFAELFFKIRAVGGSKQRPHDVLHGFLNRGRLLVRKGLFRFIERVFGVDGVADIGDRHHGLHAVLFCKEVQKRLLCFFGGGGGTDFFCGVGGNGAVFLHIRALIRNFTEFHRIFPPVTIIVLVISYFTRIFNPFRQKHRLDKTGGLR